jgi:YggT family protein
MNAIIYLIYLALTVYAWMIVLRAVLSWVHPRRGSALSRFDGVLITATEPYLAIFRRLLPMARFGAVGVDLSSVAALVVLFVVIQVVVRL